MNKKTLQMVTTLKDRGSDDEWYPTTKEIIDAVRNDYLTFDIENRRDIDNPSVLDCGAGDGRVLHALTDGKKYAIEKAKPLLNAMSKDIFIVGTNFEEQTLLDKRVTVLFSNPPFSCFETWASKIIREANANFIYLVLPSRWKNCVAIMDYIELRQAQYEVIGNFDFLNADRAARANVDIIRISLCGRGRYNSDSPKTSPFKIWFDEHFKLDIAKDEGSKFDFERRKKESLEKHLETELVPGSSLVGILEDCYKRDLAELLSTYQSLCDVNPAILKELDVNIRAVQKALEEKIVNLKDTYWHELFSRMEVVTSKLTAASRESLLRTLTAHTHVDFTASNAHAVILWVIKNANDFLSSQIIALVKTMTEKANVIAYKSNQRLYEKEDWRYTHRPDLTCYGLDYRIVLSRVGGLSRSTWQYESVNGLDKRSAILLDDIRTVATNLGFDTHGLHSSANYSWESNKKNTFEYRKIGHGIDTLFDVRAFLNGNLHIRLNSKFALRLNVEFGRINGWLKSAKEAAEELNIKESDAVESFGSNFQLTNNSLLQLGVDVAA